VAESEQIKPFVKEIPVNVRQEIEDAVAASAKDGRERSLTFCRLAGTDSIHVSSHEKGLAREVAVDSCSVKYGDAEKIGDFHVHPVHPDNMGISPSEADQTGTMEDSVFTGKRQIACISNHEAKHIHCYQPKEVPTEQHVEEYRQALGRQVRANEVAPAPFFRVNPGKDFQHAWYDKENYQRQEPPNVKAVVTDALGKAVRGIRVKRVPEMEKGIFCQLIADYSLPHMREQFIEECKKETRRRSIAGIDYEKYLVD
jgi:hypothetical protein